MRGEEVAFYWGRRTSFTSMAKLQFSHQRASVMAKKLGFQTETREIRWLILVMAKAGRRFRLAIRSILANAFSHRIIKYRVSGLKY